MPANLLIPPTTLNFIVTNKCTASCLNCCFSCNPKNVEKLSLPEMKSYIDSSLSAYKTIKLFVITGGECFLLGKNLDKIIEYATTKGLTVRVVTNAYWAKSFKSAYIRLKELIDVGLMNLMLVPETNTRTGFRMKILLMQLLHL